MRSLMLIVALALPALFARPASAADVEAVWGKHCASCHGKDGAAETTMGRKHKIKTMTTEEWQKKNSDSHNKEAILTGVKDTKMKSFKEKLAEADVDALVKYVRTFKK